MRFSSRKSDLEGQVVLVTGSRGEHSEHAYEPGTIGIVTRISRHHERVKVGVHGDLGSWIDVDDLAIMETGDPVWIGGERQIIGDLDGSDFSGAVRTVEGGRWRAASACRGFIQQTAAATGERGSDRTVGGLYRITGDSNSNRMEMRQIVKHVGRSIVSRNRDAATGHDAYAGRPNVFGSEAEPLEVGCTVAHDRGEGVLLAMVFDIRVEEPMLVKGVGWVDLRSARWVRDGEVVPVPVDWSRFTMPEGFDPSAEETRDIRLTFTVPMESLSRGIALGRATIPLSTALVDGFAAEPVDATNGKVSVVGVLSGGRFVVGSTTVPLSEVSGGEIEVMPERVSMVTFQSGMWQCTSHDHGFLAWLDGEQPRIMEWEKSGGQMVENVPVREGGCTFTQVVSGENYLFRANRSATNQITVPHPDPTRTFGGESFTVTRRPVSA